MDVPMVMVECCNCHMPFAMTSELNVELRRTHESFFCPKGHSQSYACKSDIERARDERDRAERLRALAQEELEALKKKKCKKKSVKKS